jgi:hypothetical protein
MIAFGLLSHSATGISLADVVLRMFSLVAIAVIITESHCNSFGLQIIISHAKSLQQIMHQPSAVNVNI